MLKIEIKRRGNLDKIVSGLASAVSKGLDNALENTQKEIIQTKHHMTHGTGTLDKNILTEKKNDLEGRVYTNHPALVFAEYGTGVKKDPDFPHIGTTKTFIESGRRFWFVPADKVDKPIGPLVRIDGNDYYIAFSQSARPFMRTTAFNRRADNVLDVGTAIEEWIKENKL